MSTLKSISDDRVSELAGLRFGPPVTHVYNPLIYARAAWDLYCEKYGRGTKDVILVGMNPGPRGLSIADEGLPGLTSGLRPIEGAANGTC